jgi:2-amino-4-hydroxy-6-hydroxymethyldihydropteridine diphosphokinase
VAGIAAPIVAAIALGSNRGDRRSNLDHAVRRLDALLLGTRVSAFYETAPVGVPGPQPPFLNAAAVGETTVPARALLEALLAIEQERGRERPFPGAARTLDLDLLLYGSSIISEPGLEVPHPRFRERRFVLEPLAEIAPDLRDPVSGQSVSELLAALAG